MNGSPVALAAVVMALLVGASGGACARDGASDAAGVTASPPATTSMALDARPCAADDISIGQTRPVAGTGHEVLLLKFSNRSPTPCVLSGHPRVIATESGLPNVTAEPGGFFPDPGATARMAPLEDTNLALETERDCDDRYAKPGTFPQRLYHRVVVTLPGGDKAVNVNLDVLCGLRVSRFGRIPPPGPEYVERCDGRQPRVLGDGDGDGREDRFYHDSIDGDAVVGACTASGAVSRLPGMGQGEVLQLIDFGNDGRQEIVFGATTVNSLGARVAVMVDGTLRIVDLGGEPLTLEDGPFNVDRDGQRPTSAFGCDPDGRLVRVTARVQGDELSWTREVVAISGAQARRVSIDHGRAVAAADVEGQIGALVESCRAQM